MSTAIEYQPASAPHGDSHAGEEGAVHVHAMPPRILLGVYAALMILTIATVAVTSFDFGAMNIVIALVIALVKASLVVLYFMHLKYDSPFNAVVFLSSLVFVALFIAVAILDSGQYRRNYDPPGVRQVISSQNGV